MNGDTTANFVLWWKTTCVGYSLQKDASRFATLAAATTAAAGAFAAWSSAACPGAPSIKGQDLGPVICGDTAFNIDGPNQNVIVFRDAGWPHKTAEQIRLNQSSPTVALTTVSFNRDTGEILDSDIELNTADHKITVTDTPGTGVFDLESVLTHEGGHFIGLAHSPDATSVMFFQDEGGSSKHRALAADDVAAVCAVYPSSGPRPIDKSVSANGFAAPGTCDATPRGGLSSICAPDKGPPTTTKSGCAAAPGSAGGAGGAPLGLAFAAAAAAGFRRRRRSW
jgi:MYXO-CTERM domain-containing protein